MSEADLADLHFAIVYLQSHNSPHPSVELPRSLLTIHVRSYESGWEKNLCMSVCEKMIDSVAAVVDVVVVAAVVVADNVAVNSAVNVVI